MWDFEKELAWQKFSLPDTSQRTGRDLTTETILGTEGDLVDD